MQVCSHCFRAVRKQARLDQINQLCNTSSLPRTFTTTAYRSQQASKSPIDPASSTPPFIPTTVPTITSNVTADHPETAPKLSGASASAHKPPPMPPGASTAEMQRKITSNLGSSRLTTGLSHKLATTLRSAAKSSTETYITYGLTELLFKSCAAQAPYTVPEDLRLGIYTGKGPPKNARAEDVGIPDTTNPLSKGVDSWWFQTLGLEPTFSVWSQVCFLHMYILVVKLRTLPDHKSFMDYQRYLLEHFSNAAEDKMALLHGMSARGTRNKYLKEMFIQWRGIMYAYDAGLVSGDAVLAGAVWRNLWKADEDVDWEKVAMVVAYMRRAIAGLADVSVNEIATGLQGGSQYWMQAQEGIEQLVKRESRDAAQPLP